MAWRVSLFIDMAKMYHQHMFIPKSLHCIDASLCWPCDVLLGTTEWGSIYRSKSGNALDTVTAYAGMHIWYVYIYTSWYDQRELQEKKHDFRNVQLLLQRIISLLFACIFVGLSNHLPNPLAVDTAYPLCSHPENEQAIVEGTCIYPILVIVVVD